MPLSVLKTSSSRSVSWSESTSDAVVSKICGKSILSASVEVGVTTGCGREVANLYNPKGFAPQRIVDSGLVREYVHPVTGYRLYYPAQWSIGAVDPESRQVLMSAITGDYIQIRMFERKVGETLPQWFARVVVGEQFTGFVPFS